MSVGIKISAMQRRTCTKLYYTDIFQEKCSASRHILTGAVVTHHLLPSIFRLVDKMVYDRLFDRFNISLDQ